MDWSEFWTITLQAVIATAIALVVIFVGSAIIAGIIEKIREK